MSTEETKMGTSVQLRTELLAKGATKRAMPRELPKDQKVAFEMTAGDHTELIQFAIRHPGKVSARDQRTKADLLRRFEVLAKHDKTLAPKFANAAVAVQEAEQTIEKIPKVELEKVVPIVTAVARARDMGELRQVINTEASKQEHSEAIKVGLRTAGELLDRGRDTIYSHHFWMQAFIDPREILGHLGHAGSLLRTRRKDPRSCEKRCYRSCFGRCYWSGFRSGNGWTGWSTKRRCGRFGIRCYC
jgi:hypothetical protein